MKFYKLFIVSLFAMLVAACQPGARYSNSNIITQQVYGNVQPNVPSNWVKLRDKNIIAFVCVNNACSAPEAIGYKASYGKTNVELLVRRKIISAGLVRELGNSFGNAVNQKVQTVSVRDLTNKNATGFEMTTVYHTSKGPMYVVTRALFNGREVREIYGLGPTVAKARHNLSLGIKAAN